MPEEATPAASVPPPPAAAPATPAAPPAAERDPDKWVPYSRFNEVNTQATEAKAARVAAEARAAELERKVGRLELRADLGIDDDDDADRVRAAFDKEHADVKPEKRPTVREWLKAEGALDKLPRSIRTAYGPAWAGAAPAAPAAAPDRVSPQRPAATPPTSRGTVQTPQTATQLEDSGRRTPRRPIR